MHICTLFNIYFILVLSDVATVGFGVHEAHHDERFFFLIFTGYLRCIYKGRDGRAQDADREREREGHGVRGEWCGDPT